MRAVFGLVLILGLGLAGGAVYMAKDYISQHQTALAQERALRAEIVPTMPVFVVKKPLGYGDTLKKEDVRIVKWPEEAIPEGAFTDPAILFPEGEGKERIVMRAMEKDEAILEVKVTKPGGDAGITSRLERGMRAFTIRVDVATGVSGFLRPGDRVDVYWTGKDIAVRADGRQSQGDVTKLIESAVQLIATDQTADGERTGASIARTVTVQVTPQQVAALAQAQSSGRLSLALVGNDDGAVAEVIQVDQHKLLGVEIEEAKPVAEVAEVEKAPKVCTIRTRRGADVVEIPIPCATN